MNASYKNILYVCAYYDTYMEVKGQLGGVHSLYRVVSGIKLRLSIECGGT